MAINSICIKQTQWNWIKRKRNALFWCLQIQQTQLTVTFLAVTEIIALKVIRLHVSRSVVLRLLSQIPFTLYSKKSFKQRIQMFLTFWSEKKRYFQTRPSPLSAKSPIFTLKWQYFSKYLANKNGYLPF